jgi:hypothetical protein
MMKNPTDVPPEDKSNEQEPQVFAVSKDARGVKFTRRDFLEMAGVSAATATLVGCGGKGEDSGSTIGGSGSPSETPFEPANSQPTRTPTKTRTPTPEPTDTTTPTKMPTKTATPTKTPTPTETPTPEVVVKLTSVNVRSGPGTSYPIIGVARQGESLIVLGRNHDGSWFKVELADGSEGWIAASVVDFDFDPEDIPVEQNIPTPPPQEPTAQPGTPGNVSAGETGIEYSVEGKTYTLPCGSPIPAGAVCTCNCVTAPPVESCSCDTVCTCDAVCSCAGASHYWYPN